MPLIAQPIVYNHPLFFAINDVIMQTFLDFVLRHWDLWLVFAILLILAIRLETSSKIAGVSLLSPSEVTRYINHENAIVLDIREAEQFKQGHILGAIHILPTESEKELKKLQKHKNKPIIISCSDGAKSPRFGAALRKDSFSNIFALKGGISAWQKDNLPLAKKEA